MEGRALLLLLVAIVGAAKPKLPKCDATRDLYQKGKLYEVLGVPKSATQKEIKKAFKMMSVQCHPDKDSKNDKANDNFMAIAGAYETLGDEAERKNFDKYGTAGPGTQGQQGFQGGHQWHPKDFQDINLDDIFANFFQGAPSGKQRGKQGKQHFHFNFGGDGDGDDGGFESLFASAFGNAGAGFGARPSKQKRGRGGQQGMAFGGGADFGAFGDMFAGFADLFEGDGDAFEALGGGRGRGKAKPSKRRKRRVEF
eukprot:m.108253 g.108253  ORF g.108253 m.108253 type:complete len:254 (-) comp15331_c0_seq1:1910-2671(-)